MSEHDPTRDEREAAFRAALRFALAAANDDAMIEGLPDDDLADAGAAFALACRDYVRAVDRHPHAVEWPYKWVPDDTAKLRNKVAELTEQNVRLRAMADRDNRVIEVFMEYHRNVHQLPDGVRKKVIAAMDGVDVSEVRD